MSGKILFSLLSVIPLHSTSHFAPFNEVTTKKESAYTFYIPHPSDQIDGADYFFHSCFTFPEILKRAHKEHKSLLLLIPDSYHEVCTIGNTSPFMEGARIALAWASAFFRFADLGNIDIRTLVIPRHFSQDQILNCMNYALFMDFETQALHSPEEKMAQRIIQAADFEKPILKEIHVSHNDPTPKVFSNTSDQKTIVITGVAGFLGSHLAQAYLDKGYAVIGFDNFICSTGENLIPLKKNSNFIFYKFDVSQPYSIEGRVDLIAHLASIPSPADYYKMPLETLRSGLHGAKEALELASRKNARIILASSSEVYGNPKIHPQKESYWGNVNPIAMRSQYDESKRGEETLCKMYFDKYGTDIRIARIFNTFGPGMRLEDGRVMTNFIQAALANKPMTIHGDGKQTRSPAFVTDTINGLMLLLESDVFSSYKELEPRICNIGTPKEYNVNQIAETVNNVSKKLLGRTVPMNHIPHIDPTDPKVRRPDISHIQSLTGFKPAVTFEEGIEKMFIHFMKRQQIS